MTQQVAISHGDYLAGQLVYRQTLPVSIFNFVKTAETPTVDLNALKRTSISKKTKE
jgi:hypothetical protein